MSMKVCDLPQALFKMLKRCLQRARTLCGYLTEFLMPKNRWQVVKHSSHHEYGCNNVSVGKTRIDLFAESDEDFGKVVEDTASSLSIKDG